MRELRETYKKESGYTWVCTSTDTEDITYFTDQYVEWLEEKLYTILDIVYGDEEVEEAECMKECGNTQPSSGRNNICLNCGSSIK